MAKPNLDALFEFSVKGENVLGRMRLPRFGPDTGEVGGIVTYKNHYDCTRPLEDHCESPHDPACNRIGRALARFHFGLLPYSPKMTCRTSMRGGLVHCTLSLYVPDVEGAGQIEVRFTHEFIKDAVLAIADDALLFDQLRKHVQWAYSHEVDEQLRVDRERRWNPHPNKRSHE